MKLTPTRPVTIDRARPGQRWFPRIFRHTDGTLFLYAEAGYDAHFSPDFRLESHDGGKTWGTPTDNVPRAAWCHSFADGGLFEIDVYGVHDPNTPATTAMFGAWTRPGGAAHAGVQVERGLVRVHVPSGQKTPLRALTGHAYPTYPWWPLWNGLFGRDNMTIDEIKLISLCFHSGLEVDGRLLALTSWDTGRPEHKGNSVFVVESRDRGHNWEEVTTIAAPGFGGEGMNECTLLRLRDGRLYIVARTGGPLVHTWSQDSGKTWSPTEPMKLADTGETVRGVWPIARTLSNGTLALVYGRPGKNLVIDPTGTGTGWRGRLDLHAWEIESQAIMGVPPDQRLDNSHDAGVRYWNSGDYLGMVEVAPRVMLVVYDVQTFHENWNAEPYSGVRMVRVTLED